MAKNTIKLKSYSSNVVEYEAAETITPGALVEINSSDKVQNHSNAGQNALIMFAVEDDLQGNGIDDDYSSGDMVQVWIPQRGDEVYAFLEDGNDVDTNNFLESAGNGNLQKHTPDTESIATDSSAAVASFYTNQIIAQPLEDVDLSASSAAESSALQGDQRLKIRIV